MNRATFNVTQRGAWRLAAGAALAAALVGGVAAGAYAHGPGMMHGGGPGMMAGGPMAMHGRGIERMLDRVDASAEQRTQIRAIVDAAQRDLAAQHEAGRALRAHMLELFAQPTVDAAAAEAQRRQMLQHHDQVSQRTLQAMLDVSRVLTPEQRATLAERMKAGSEMMQRHQRERRQLDGQRRS